MAEDEFHFERLDAALDFAADFDVLASRIVSMLSKLVQAKSARRER
jgi:hypothetical protein